MQEDHLPAPLHSTTPAPLVPGTKVSKTMIDMDKAPELVTTVASALNALHGEGKIKMLTTGTENRTLHIIAGDVRDLHTVIQLLHSDPDAPPAPLTDTDIVPSASGECVLQLNDQQSLYLLKIAGLKVSNLSDRRNDGRLAAPSRHQSIG